MGRQKSKQGGAGAVDPVLSPALGQTLKDTVLSIRVSARVLEYVESELAKLGVKTSRERQAFYRGAIVAGVENARRADSRAWKKFVAAIQPQARRHLGLGLNLDGVEEISRAGG